MDKLWKGISIFSVMAFLAVLLFTPHFHWGFFLGGAVLCAIIAEH